LSLGNTNALGLTARGALTVAEGEGLARCGPYCPQVNTRAAPLATPQPDERAAANGGPCALRLASCALL